MHTYIHTYTHTYIHACIHQVLEVGAGCGLLGLVLAQLGCHVTLTEAPVVMEYLNENVERNGAGDGKANAMQVCMCCVYVCMYVWCVYMYNENVVMEYLNENVERNGAGDGQANAMQACMHACMYAYMYCVFICMMRMW
jgi:hypothetical protein